MWLNLEYIYFYHFNKLETITVSIVTEIWADEIVKLDELRIWRLKILCIYDNGNHPIVNEISLLKLLF